MVSPFLYIGTIAKDVGIQLQGSLEHGGKIRYEFEMPLEGMTVNLCVSEGQVHLYSSFLLPNPNSALYDYKCKAHAVDNSLCDDVFIPKNSASTTQKVYTSLEGIGEHMSDYLLLTLIGDQTSHEDHLYGMYYTYSNCLTCTCMTTRMYFFPMHSFIII